MPRFDVTTIGEGQLRYCVPAGTRLEQATSLDVFVTGTEGNVTSLLSRLGWRCGWVSFSARPIRARGRRYSRGNWRKRASSFCAGCAMRPL